jgi:hypothetical protein
MYAPRPSATGPIDSHAGCDAWRATVRCAALAIRAESPSRRSRDPREHKPAAAAVAPSAVQRGNRINQRQGFLRVVSVRAGQANRERHAVRRRLDDVCSRAWPDRWESDRSGHRRAPRGLNNCPRSRATNQSGRRARANPGAQSGSDPRHPPVASCSRRQHIIPDPHPSSGGSVCQGTPLRRTKTMPVRQARSETRGPVTTVRGMIDRARKLGFLTRASGQGQRGGANR